MPSQILFTPPPYAPFSTQPRGPCLPALGRFPNASCPSAGFVEMEDDRDANDAVRALDRKNNWVVEFSRGSKVSLLRICPPLLHFPGRVVVRAAPASPLYLCNCARATRGPERQCHQDQGHSG